MGREVYGSLAVLRSSKPTLSKTRLSTWKSVKSRTIPEHPGQYHDNDDNVDLDNDTTKMHENAGFDVLCRSTFGGLKRFVQSLVL